VTFQVRAEPRSGATLWVLEDDDNRAEIHPDKGFNCFHWSVSGLDLLYADPQFLQGGSPTRTGIPILFPFPNRIRDGRFTWVDEEYSLPRNDPAKKNAIHGFACRRPWRVVERGDDAESAWVTGEFIGSRDARDCRSLWPADYSIRVTYRLQAGKLRMEATVSNPDRVPLPFGLGYHHYFRVDADNSLLHVPARSYWELQDTLPTGARRPVSGPRDLNQPKPFQDLEVDDVLADLSGDAGELVFRGSVRRTQGTEVRLHTSPAFREAVVFTPPHRQAFCIEPYTCTTDAINLQQRGVDAGLLVLEAGQTWSAVVEMCVASSS
jgi:aldose 1-epimerase